MSFNLKEVTENNADVMPVIITWASSPDRFIGICQRIIKQKVYWLGSNEIQLHSIKFKKRSLVINQTPKNTIV